MYSSALVVFRETLEAALIIGILAAATRGVLGRGTWISTGIFLGILGAVFIATGTEAIAQFAGGLGQELLNAIILSIAVCMLAWHNIWMASHGKALAASARGLGEEVRAGTRARSVIMVVVALAVLREGAETVLFLYGISASGYTDTHLLMLGGLIGAVSGIAVGYFLFTGLLHIPIRWFFAVTTLLILLLAAGLASQAAGFLIQAGFLPSLANPLWDFSTVLSERSVIGTFLHGLVGYTARPAGMQVIFYVAAILIITTGMKLVNRSPQLQQPAYKS